MTVNVSQKARTSYSASFADFKNAFSLTAKGVFKHSAEKTKGVLYVKNGVLRSANIHGGRGSVQSAVTNAALREALLKAFESAGVSDDFLGNLKNDLMKDPKGDLKRSVVKDLICRVENHLKELDEGNGVVPRQPLGSRTINSLRTTDKNAQLSKLLGEHKTAAKTITTIIRGEFSGGIHPASKDALLEFSQLRTKMAEICKSALRQKGISISVAKGMLRQAVKDFIKTKPSTMKNLSAFLQRDASVYASIYPGLETALVALPEITEAHERLKKTHVVRSQTEPIKGVVGSYIDGVLNNAADGNCLFYSVEDAMNDLPSDDATSDHDKANEMRAELAQHIKKRLEEASDRPSPNFSGLCRRDGQLFIPHSFDKNTLIDELIASELTDPDYSLDCAYIPLDQVPFLADMLKRPIVVLMDIQYKDEVDSRMLCCNRDLKTGNTLNGDPIAIYFYGGHGTAGHYQAVKLNQA